MTSARRPQVDPGVIQSSGQRLYVVVPGAPWRDVREHLTFLRDQGRRDKALSRVGAGALIVVTAVLCAIDVRFLGALVIAAVGAGLILFGQTIAGDDGRVDPTLLAPFALDIDLDLRSSVGDAAPGSAVHQALWKANQAAAAAADQRRTTQALQHEDTVEAFHAPGELARLEADRDEAMAQLRPLLSGAPQAPAPG